MFAWCLKMSFFRLVSGWLRFPVAGDPSSRPRFFASFAFHHTLKPGRLCPGWGELFGFEFEFEFVVLSPWGGWFSSSLSLSSWCLTSWCDNNRGGWSSWSSGSSSSSSSGELGTSSTL